MKVLWFTNMPTPELPEYLGFPKLMSGHWMSEMLSALKEHVGVLHDPVTARKIEDAGRQVCKTEIHWRLADFFTTCIRSAQ